MNNRKNDKYYGAQPHSLRDNMAGTKGVGRVGLQAGRTRGIVRAKI